jgi:hypothetical protein
MNYRFASLIAASLTLSGSPQGVVSAQPVRHEAADVEVIVSGVPQRRYLHDGRWYVEAVKGREYAIRMRNPFPVRVAVALSVDGLNTIDARHTAASESRKWVIEPFQTITISGWQVNRAEARRFEFTTEARSYGQALGQTDNLGVISAVFFKERAPAIMTRESDDRNAHSERLTRTGPQPPFAAAAPADGSNTTADATTTKQPAVEEYAATGMGERTGHAVRQVYLDLEGSPAQTVNIRYEFRPQLVRLGILPAAPVVDPLARRERSRGFESGFSPEVPRR